MNENFRIILLREDNTRNERAAAWFHDKWKVPVEAYLESMEACQQVQDRVPQWYVVMDGDAIIAGMGVIENDFHERKDLSPNVCAVYVEEAYRGQGLARDLLQFVCEDMAALGYSRLYLLTSHTEFYERCGWEFFCYVKEDCGSTARMYRHVVSSVKTEL